MDPRTLPTCGIQKIREEHRSISAVLQALKQLARDAQGARVIPDFAVFRAMLDYIDRFPEELHHPKEEQYLFARLVLRVPEAQALVDSLRAEHKQGEKLVGELEGALILFEQTWPAGGPMFQQTVDAYADHHWKHMRKEELELLPLAERYLSGAEWQLADRAFGGNEDPIAGVKERDFRMLFELIVKSAAPAAGLE